MKAVEKQPYVPAHDVQLPPPALGVRIERSQEWRAELPTLTGPRVTLREVQPTDAASLLAAISSADVARFLSPPPTSLEGFERFIAWSHRQRAAGQYIAFGLMPRGSDAAVGVLQIRSLEPDFGTAEWGFALATEFWGTGLFTDAAQLAVDFVFDVIGTHRLEARAALKNGRGNGALRKLGAVQEGVLRRSFLRNGEHHDQMLWTILADEWRESKGGWCSGVIH